MSIEANFVAPRVGNGAVRIWLYAGKPGVSRATRNVRSDVYSDNVTGAENQQESPIEFRGWIIGFVDGEGCFSIGFVRQPPRPPKRLCNRFPGDSRVRCDARRSERRRVARSS